MHLPKSLVGRRFPHSATTPLSDRYSCLSSFQLLYRMLESSAYSTTATTGLPSEDSLRSLSRMGRVYEVWRLWGGQWRVELRMDLPPRSQGAPRMEPVMRAACSMRHAGEQLVPSDTGGSSRTRSRKNQGSV